MTLAQIQYFLELSRTMNFTKAAANLYITQPTLSRQIQLLEAELEVKLLNRTNREVELTDAGKVFQEEFSKIDERIENALYKVKTAKRRKNEIRIGFSGAIIPFHVFSFVDKIREEYPEYFVLINQYSDYELKRDLENEKLDIVISLEAFDLIADERNSDGFSCRRFWELPAYIVYADRMFPEGYNPTIGDFRDKKFIRTNKEYSDYIIKRQRDVIKSVGLSYDEEIAVDNVLTELLLNNGQDMYSVYINGDESGLRTIELPDTAKKFGLMAYWKNDTRFDFQKFFNERF